MPITDYILRTQSAYLKLCAPCNEASGTTAYDLTANHYDLLTQGDGWKFPTPDDNGAWDNVAGASRVMIHATATKSLAIQAVGTYLTYVCIPWRFRWTDNVTQILGRLVNGSNGLAFSKTGNPGVYRISFTSAGNPAQNFDSPQSLRWVSLGLTWNKAANVVKAYRDGVLIGTGTYAGTWGTPLNTAAVTSNPNACAIANVALWDYALNDDEMLEVGGQLVANKGFDAQTWIDYDSEKSTTRMRTVAITASNYDAQGTLRTALHVAAAGIVLGVLNKNMFGNEDLVANTPASSQSAQRELKWLVSFHDATTLQAGSYEIPCADIAQLDPNDRAHAHIGDSDVVDAYVTAAEAFYLSNAGNAIVIDEITLVGRPV